MTQTLQVKRLPNIGAEVFGFDLNAPITEAVAEELKALWYEHAVLLFRDQDIDTAKQIEFSRIFGPLERHPLEVKISQEHPELFVLQNGGKMDAANTAFYSGEAIVGRLDWHMDLHYTGKPNHGAMIYGLTIPEEGGETGFGDLGLAYEALDAETKALIAPLEVAYRFNMQRRDMRFVDISDYEPGPHSPKKPSDVGFPDFPDSIYPIVVKHPVTGRPVLEIVEQFLDRVIDPAAAGLSDTEADALLQRLVEHTRKPEFHYFHEWRPGDMVLWDNWRAMHCAMGTKPGVDRLLHRTTIAGDVALGRQ